MEHLLFPVEATSSIFAASDTAGLAPPSPTPLSPGRNFFRLNHKRPPTSPPARHIPQLFLEMLCAKADSALIAVETAAEGMNVFRVRMDQAYARRLLEMAAEFARLKRNQQQRKTVGSDIGSGARDGNGTHPNPLGPRPPHDLFEGTNEHEALLTGALVIASKAELVASVSPEEMVRLVGSGTRHAWWSLDSDDEDYSDFDSDSDSSRRDGEDQGHAD